MKINFYARLFVFVFLSFSSMPHLSGQWTVLNTSYTNLTLDDIYASVSGDTLIAVGTDVSAGFTGHTLFSFDAGNTWDTARFNSGYLFKGIAFADNSTGVIAALGAVGCALRTTDGGATWTWNWCDQTYSGVYDIQFENNGTGYMAGYGDSQFGDGTVYKTTDAGQSWANISGSLKDMPMEYIQVVDQNVMYAGSFLFFNEKLYRSVDGGANWDSLDVTATGAIEARFLNASTGILLGRGGKIYRTTDSAQSWVKVGEFTSLPSLKLSALAFTDTLHGFVAGFANQKTHFMHTTDGGLTWALQPNSISGLSIIRLRAFGNRVYGVGELGRVVVSPSTGVSLQEVNSNIPGFYPNPAEDKLFVAVSDPNEIEDLNIYDFSGKAVEVHYQIEENQIQVNIRNLKTGIYVLKVSTKAGHYAQKIMVE